MELDYAASIHAGAAKLGIGARKVRTRLPFDRMPDDPVAEPAPPTAAVPNPLVDPNLTKSLTADYEALKNDLEQATEFAAELQKELAGSKNDAAHFKQVFEKTQRDLAQLQDGIVALRKERHALANEAMRATALDLKLKTIAHERDSLLESLAETQRREEELVALIKTRDAQVAELTMQLMMLKEELREVKQRVLAAQTAPRVMKSAAAERVDE
jgi:chromosome segregation ATPase